ncbi:hypothetical protein GGF50DRAFT_106961 [Schizophyllum commune]
MDAATAKQMAALTAAGQLRHASTRSFAGPGGGTNSAAFGSPGPSAAHDLSSPSTPLQSGGSMHANNFPPDAAAAAQQNPALARQIMMAQQHKRFLMTLHQFHINRGNPLPPQLTGIPSPTFNPQTTIWKQVELCPTEHGAFRVAGKDVPLLRLWQIISQAGGFNHVSAQNLWPRVIQMFDIPPEMPGTRESAAMVLKSYYNGILAPFEELHRNNKNAQQQLAQPVQPAAPDPMGAIGGAQVPNSFPDAAMSPSASRGRANASLPPSTPQASGPAPLDLPADTMVDNAPNVDSGLKRKLELEEAEMKRSRQKTEPTPDVASAVTAAPPSASGSVQGSRARARPMRRKIEYVPFAREVDTFGGRDLAAMEKYAEEARRRPIRDFNDWGNIDVDHLIMSLRSRVATELSYALTTLSMLSAMRISGPNSGFQISLCPDLLDELLDLLEDTAFEGAMDTDADALDDDTFTHRELMNHVYDEEDQPFAVLKPKQAGKPNARGPLPPPSHTIQIIMGILRNLCAFEANCEFLAGQTRLYDCVLRLCSFKRDADGSPNAASPALSLTNLIATRKEALYMLCNLAPYTRFTKKDPANPPKVALRRAKYVFQLLASFIIDDTESVPPLQHAQLWANTPPQHYRPSGLTDIALEALTSVCQPDSNRQVLAKALPSTSLWRTFTALVHRLPVAEADFQLVSRDVWYAYTEKLLLALYSLAFFAPPATKAKLARDRSLAVRAVLMRVVHKLTRGVDAPEMRQWFTAPVRRAIETLKVLEDAADPFVVAEDTAAPTLSFGMGFGQGGESTDEEGHGLLAAYREHGLEVLLAMQAQESVPFNELDSLIRVEV